MGSIGTPADEQLTSIVSQTQTVSEYTTSSEWSQGSTRLPENWAAASTKPDSSCTLIHEGAAENLKIYAPSLSRVDSRSTFFIASKRVLRHKRPVSTLLPIGFLVGYGGIWDRMRVRCRLWRISWRIRRDVEIPSGFYRDLVEIQRTDRDTYTDSERCKAWSLLARLAAAGHIQKLVEALMKFPPHVTIAYLHSLAGHHPSNPSPLYSLLSIIQVDRPLLLHDGFDLDHFCAILMSQTPRLDSLDGFGLYPFFDGIAKMSQPAGLDQLPLRPPFAGHPQDLGIEGWHGHKSCWDLPLFAQCLLQFLVPGDNRSIRRVVAHVLVSVTPFAQESPKPKDIQHILQYHPHIFKSPLHPVRPFILFAIHLAYRSEVAARAFIDHGMLQMIGRLWLYDFRDPREGGWHGLLVQNDMRVGSLLFLCALARHYPSARDMINHLLQQMLKPRGSLAEPVLSLEGSGSACHYQSLYDLAGSHCHSSSCAIPNLTLNLLEISAMNDVRMFENACQYGEPWTAVLNILGSRRTDTDFTRLKHSAARALFALASLPEERWSTMTAALCKQSVEDCGKIFEFIINTFLLVRDPQRMIEQDALALRKMSIYSLSRGSETVNPVERFTMLVRVRQVTGRAQFSSMLVASGMLVLLSAVSCERYSFLCSTGKVTESQSTARGTLCLRMMNELRASAWASKALPELPTEVVELDAVAGLESTTTVDNGN